MNNIDKLDIVGKIDLACDCVPGLSFLTNCLEILYKVARKTDAAANPVSPGWKSAIKFHVLEKPLPVNIILMIPVLGNLIALIKLVYSARHSSKSNSKPPQAQAPGSLLNAIQSNSKPPQAQAPGSLLNAIQSNSKPPQAQAPGSLLNAIQSGDMERVQLGLALFKSGLEDPGIARKVLAHAAAVSNHQIFKVIFALRTWRKEDLEEVVNLTPIWYKKTRSAPVADLVKNTCAVLDYLDLRFKKEQIEVGDCLIEHWIGVDTDEARRIIDRLVERLPSLGFKAYHSTLTTLSYPRRKNVWTGDRHQIIWKKQLTPEQVDIILARCTTCSLSQVAALAVTYSRADARAETKPEDRRMVEQALQAQYRIVENLLSKVQGVPDSKEIVENLSGLASGKTKDLFGLFLEKYEAQLDAKAKEKLLVAIIGRIPHDGAAAIAESLLTKYESRFSKEEFLSLKGRFLAKTKPEELIAEYTRMSLQLLPSPGLIVVAS